MPVGLLILVLLIGIPLLEIAVFVEVGSEIGAVPTIPLTVLTALAGTVMLRLQGVSLLMKIRSEMDAGRVPGSDLVQGALIVVASILLLIPGFVTDAVGLLLFVPPLAPPFMAFTRMAILVHGSSKRADACPCVNHTPRSDGIESKPQVCTMRAPFASAVVECVSIMRCIHWGSPVRSTESVPAAATAATSSEP